MINYYNTIFQFKSNLDMKKVSNLLLEYDKRLKEKFSKEYLNTFTTYSTTIASHLLRFHYDVLEEIEELKELRDEIINGFKISFPNESGNFALHSWINVGGINEQIKSHTHIPSYFCFVYVDVEDSTTTISINNIPNSKIVIEGEDGLITIAKGRITPHHTSKWKNPNKFRITLAVNIIDIDDDANENDKNYLTRFMYEPKLFKFNV